jgi:RNase P subunit RPR2
VIFVKRKKQAIIGLCENCHRELTVPVSNTINPHRPTIDLKGVVACECGEYHNLIVPPGGIKTAPRKSPDIKSNEQIICPRCGSTQLHAGKKGFSFGKSLAGGVLFGAVGFLGGTIGQNKIMVTCLRCGYKWQASKTELY